MSNIQLHKQILNNPATIKRVGEMLGSERKANAFITSALSVINSNNLLLKASPESVFQAALTAASLDLPINQNLGFAYIVPYKGQAQFQLGYKGLIQLAQRSGQFQTISASAIYEGQLVEENPLTGFKFDFTVKGEKVIGYAGYFKLINGFEKTFYMDVEQVKAHAEKYSQTYNKKNKYNELINSPWNDPYQFDSMALKTVLKLNLKTYAPLSTEMERAIVSDQAVIKDSDSLEVEYVDNQPLDPAYERAEKLINDCKTTKELETLSLPVEYDDLIKERYEYLTKQESANV